MWCSQDSSEEESEDDKDATDDSIIDDNVRTSVGLFCWAIDVYADTSWHVCAVLEWGADVRLQKTRVPTSQRSIECVPTCLHLCARCTILHTGGGSGGAPEEKAQATS